MAYHPKSLQAVFSLQIIAGLISLVLGIVSLAKEQPLSVLGFGIWFGVWVIITGTLGVLGSRNPQVPDKCLLGTSLVFTIASCVFCWPIIIWYTIVLAFRGNTTNPERRTTDAIASLLLIIAFFEFVVGVGSSEYCCAAVCSTRTSGVQGSQQVVYVVPVTEQASAASGEMVVMPGGPTSTIVQPQAGQFIIQQPEQPQKGQEVPPAYSSAE